MAELPTVPFILSLLGGVFFIIGGVVLVGIGALIGTLGSIASSINSTAIAASGGGPGPFTSYLGASGVVLGIATIGLAVMMFASPARHRLWGAFVIAFSVLSWVDSFGGLVIGFILGLIGGILAVTWKPSVAVPAPPPVQITRICPNCGTVIQQDSKFCSYCGKSLP